MKRKFKVLLVYPNVTGSTLVPLHLPILSACLKEEGFKVKLFDTTNYSVLPDFEKQKESLLQVSPFERDFELQSEEQCYVDFQKMVDDYKPNLIGISLVEDTIPFGLKLLESLKDKKIPVVAGGVGVTFWWKELLDSNLIDFTNIGEGEKSLVELCHALKDKKDVSYEEPNNIYWLKDDGKYHIANLNPPIDLATLPTPDYSIFPRSRITRIMNGKQYRMLQVEVDRGCLFSCTYCCAPALKQLYSDCKHLNYYRQKKPHLLIQEMKQLKKKYKPDYFNFSAETFLARPWADVEDFMKEYKKEINLPFWCQSRPETIDNRKMQALKMGGCTDFQIGLESGSAEIRKTWMNRGGTNEELLEKFKLIEKYKIPYTVNVILLPSETRDTVFESIEFCRQINPKTINVYLLAIYKGTWFYDRAIKKKIIKKGDKTQQLLSGNSTMKFSPMTKNQVLGLQRTFPMYVKFDKSLWPRIKKAETVRKEFDRLRCKYIREFY